MNIVVFPAYIVDADELRWMYACSLSLYQSLHNLGLTHVLRMYICGGTMEDQQCTGEMAEYRYEAAWRCSMWENMETR